MATKMTHTARAELAHVIRRRYAAGVGKEKRRILEEFVAAAGYHEKSAIRVLNSQPAQKRRQTRHVVLPHVILLPDGITVLVAQGHSQ